MKLDTLIFGGQKHVNMIRNNIPLPEFAMFSIPTIFLICCLLPYASSIERLSSVFGRENYVIFLQFHRCALSFLFRPLIDPFDFFC